MSPRQRATGNSTRLSAGEQGCPESSPCSGRLATIRSDEDHSVGENREIIAGRAESGRLLLVSFTVRGEAFGIINARELTRSERKAYEEERA